MSGKLGNVLSSAFFSIAKDDSSARIHHRAAAVRTEFKFAVEWIYGASAGEFLKHVNSVYITKRDGEPNRLIVYLDESIYAADLNAQREVVKELVNQKYKEDIQLVEIHVSRGGYKNNHPYFEEADAQRTAETYVSDGREIEQHELSAADAARIDELSEKIDDPAIRKVFKKAMQADLKTK